MMLIGGYFAAIGVVAWSGFHSANGARATLTALAQKRVILDGNAVRIEEQIAACDRDRARFQATLEDIEATRDVATAKNCASPHQKWLAELAANPNLFALWLKNYRAALGERYRPFYQKLGLSPAQIDDFEDLMTRNRRTKVELEAVALSEQLADSDPVIAEVQKEKNDQLCAAQLFLLGQAGYQQLQQYSRVLPFRSIVNVVAGLVAFTSSPITSSQEERLMQVLANAGGRNQSRGSIEPDLATMMTMVDWDQVLAQAPGILSGTQLDALRAESQGAHALQLLKQFYKQRLSGM